MSGAAALAGSIFNFFAINGSIPPAIFAEIKDIVIVRLTTKLIAKVIFFEPKIYNLTKFVTNNIAPQIKPTANSFLKTIKISFIFKSSTAIPRITIVELCPPALPAVDIMNGIDAESIATALSLSSKYCKIYPVNVAEIIKIKSQDILDFTISFVSVFKYEPSVGVIPLIL